MKPIYIHSGMAGAPQYANANGNINGILRACLINGFNSNTAASASASGGVLTLNFASDPGFEALQTVEVALSSVAMVNGRHRVVANTNNQVTIDIAGLPDGAVGSSGAGITVKQAGAGWSEPFSSGATISVFRPPSGSRQYLKCINAAGADFSARGYEDMTSVDIGTNPFPSFSQSAGSVPIQNNGFGAAAGVPWFIIAADKWVYFSLANDIVPGYSLGVLFFGDAFGKTAPEPAYSALICVYKSWYMSRNYSGEVLSQDCSLAIPVDASVWPSVIAGGGFFIPYAQIREPSVGGGLGILRGFLPNGYVATPMPVPNQFKSTFVNASGVDSRFKPISQHLFDPYPVCIAVDEVVW